MSKPAPLSYINPNRADPSSSGSSSNAEPDDGSLMPHHHHSSSKKRQHRNNAFVTTKERPHYYDNDEESSCPFVERQRRRVTGEGIIIAKASNSNNGSYDSDPDHDDECEDDEVDDCGSEGGDDFHCSQIVVIDSSDDDDDDSLEEEDDEKLGDSKEVTSSSRDKNDTNNNNIQQNCFPSADDDDDDDEEEEELSDEDEPLINLIKDSQKKKEESFSVHTHHLQSPVNPHADDKEETTILLQGAQNEDNGRVGSGSKNNNSMTCFVCGSSLSHIASLKGRLNHIKRCSKRHGFQAKDVRMDDEHEQFVQQTTTASGDGGSDDTPPSRSSGSSSTVNPYNKNSTGSKQWHGDAVVDLTLAATTTATSAGSSSSGDSSGARQQPTAGAATKPCINSVLMAGARRKVAAAKTSIPSVNNVLMAGARKAAKLAKIKASAPSKSNDNNNNNRRGWGGRKRIDYSKRACPFYKKIPGTDFVCDGFLYARPSLTKNYFLTHFHSDHYGGITKRWDSGIIYCSLATANLVNQQLGVDRKYLHPLPMQSPVVVASQGNKPVTVTLLDANHCPGAVMFLFEVGKRRILHVGDFRWNRAKMLEQPALRSLMTQQEQRVDDLFLDTTYCDAKYVLPTQDVAVQAAVEVAVREVQAAKSARKRLLMLFGAYTIGKERIYLAVAQRLGLKVYVDSRRYRILSALDWPKEKLSRLLTTRPEETTLWVVPLGHINMKKMKEYLSVRIGKSFARDFDRVIGFRPTGWSMTAKGDGIVKSSGSIRGKLACHSVPYSEHSSFPELVDCISCLRPRRIIPTVSVSKSQQQVDLLLSKVQF